MKIEIAGAVFRNKTSRLLGLCFVLFLALCAWLVTKRINREPASGLAGRAKGIFQDAKQARSESKPWGDLEHLKFWIERPDEFIYVDHASNIPASWFFENYTRELLANYLSSTGASKDQLALLLDQTRWESVTNGVIISPSNELILSLDRQARQRIYSVLADSPQNGPQNLAFTFPTNEFKEWFYRSNLSAETLKIVEPLLYHRGATVCFADLAVVLPMIPSNEERKRLVKTLSRQSAVLVKLVVKPDTDIDSMVRYWGREGRAKDIRPLLESLARRPDGATIDLVHLLPPFARLRAYTFPYPSDDPLATRRDCFWTAMNFFNQQPDDRFCDFESIKKVLQTDYYPIQNDPVYGDIIVLINARGTIIHAAVYLADNKVFTKNGGYFLQPWLIMDFDDMLAFYPSDKPLRVAAYRQKRS